MVVCDWLLRAKPSRWKTVEDPGWASVGVRTPHTRTFVLGSWCAFRTRQSRSHRPSGLTQIEGGNAAPGGVRQEKKTKVWLTPCSCASAGTRACSMEGKGFFFPWTHEPFSVHCLCGRRSPQLRAQTMCTRAARQRLRSCLFRGLCHPVSLLSASF